MDQGTVHAEHAAIRRSRQQEQETRSKRPASLSGFKERLFWRQSTMQLLVLSWTRSGQILCGGTSAMW